MTKFSLTFCVCCLLFLTLLRQASAGPNDAVTISDAELRKIIETRLGKSPGATIIESEMNGMTGQIFTDSTSTGRSNSITNLTGLEHATGITNMSFHLESIQNLTPLANLTQLTHLELENNKATLNLTPLKKLTNLTTLLVRRNRIRSDAPAPITDISGLVDLTKLTRLELSDQRVSSFSALAKMTSLTKLVLSGNRRGVVGSPLSVSHLSKLTALTYLDLRDCDVRNISHLRSLTSLTQLYLDGNTGLRDISVVSNFTALTELRLAETNITNAGLSAVLDDLSSLATLVLEGTAISDLTVLDSLPGQTLSLLGLVNMGPPYLSTAGRGWLLKDIASLVNTAQNKMTSSARIQLYYNWNLNYPSIYTVVPNLLTNGVSLPFFLQDVPDPELQGASSANHLGRPGTRHTFVVRASMDYFNGYAVNRRFQGVPVTWTVTAPDGTETVEETPTGTDGLSRFSITLGDHGEEHTAIAVVPAKSNTPGPSHDELRVSFTAMSDRNAPIPPGLTVTFEDYPEDRPTEEFPLTIKFSELVTGFEAEDITVETELERGTGNPATLKTLTPVEGPEQTYTATIEVPPRAAGTLKLIVHLGAAFGSISGQFGPATDTASEPIEFGRRGPLVFPSYVAMDKVIFNEFRNVENDTHDWIELKNISDKEVSLKDYEISMVASEGEHRDIDRDIVAFPDWTLPAGGILLILNTDPSENDLLRGQNLENPNHNPDLRPWSLIRPEMILPDTPYLLILRSARDKNGKWEGFEDLVGDYHRGDVNYRTQIWPLRDTWVYTGTGARLSEAEAWQRVMRPKGAIPMKPMERGYFHDAWTVSEYQSGLGYDPNASPEMSLGTPGYATRMESEVGTGQISISEVMFATDVKGSPSEWIELYNPSATEIVDLDGWRLVLEGRDSRTAYHYTELTFKPLEVLPNQTVLLVARDHRNSGNIPERRIYNIYRRNRQTLRLGTQGHKLLGSEGFALRLFSVDGTLVDMAGNLNGRQGLDKPRWALPSGWTESGVRSSLIRRYEDRVPWQGTVPGSWVRASDTALLVGYSYWGLPTDDGTPGYRQGSPLPVELSSFRADLQDGSVFVKWTTASEMENAGFYVLRSREKTSGFLQVNPALIPGAGTTAEGQTYTYQDTTAGVNIPYYYRLEEVSLSGERRAVATVRLRGYVSAANKLLWKWADVKAAD